MHEGFYTSGQEVARVTQFHIPLVEILDTWPQLTVGYGAAMCPKEKQNTGICKHQQPLQQMFLFSLFRDALGTTCFVEHGA